MTFVQPPKGEAYFYTRIAFSTTLRNSKESQETQIFTDSDLALAGKLKLIFEREKMVWFEIKEETSELSTDKKRVFALYYYPHRLVVSRVSPLDEEATLQDIKKLFDFIVTEAQTRFAEVKLSQWPSAYGSPVGKSLPESYPARIVAEADEAIEESSPISLLAEDLSEEPIEAVSTKQKK